jgi:hypothetical protein
LLSLAERGHVQHHRAQGERAARGAEGHRGVGAVEHAEGEQREQKRPESAANRQAAVLGVEALAEGSVAPEQQRPEAEQLHLLGVVVVGEDVLEVRHAPRVGGAPVADAEGGGAELHLHDRRGDGGDGEPHHGEHAELEQEHRVARQGDGVLHDLEGLCDDRQGPRRGLAASTRELVVELGIFEVGELEGERLLEDEAVDVEREARPEQPAHEAEGALREGLRGDEGELHEHPTQRLRLGAGHHRVDDGLADVGDGEGQERGDHGEGAEGEARARR